MKKVLFLCTGNSCRSIIAEALVNAKLDNVEAKSAGVKANGRVHGYAKEVLKERGIWDDRYHSKVLDEVLKEEFDLVVTVCDNAKESCPMFPYKVPLLHVSFEDPDGKERSEFEKTFELMEKELLPMLKDKLC